MRSEGGQFDALRERLLRGGIAPRHVRRYLTELDDHLADLTEQEITAGYPPAEAAARALALLGSEDELAKPWLADPRLKSFPARAPWLVFLLTPPLILCVGFVLALLLWAGIGLAGGALGSGHHGVPGWFRTVSQVWPWIANVSVAPLAAASLALLARRQRMPMRWPLMAALLLAVLGTRLQIIIASHSISAGFGLVAPTGRFLGHPQPFDGAVYALQFVLTLLPMGILAAWRRAARFSRPLKFG